jgi:hypothetical protein
MIRMKHLSANIISLIYLTILLVLLMTCESDDGNDLTNLIL